MLIYTVLEAHVAVLASILLAVRTKKADGVVYGKLDKLGRITNIVLIPIYTCLALFCMAIAMFSYPGYDGILGIIGWIVCIIIASAPLFCALGLGFSVYLRKKGKSKLSFVVQFAGFVGCALSIILFLIFYGNLLESLN